MRRQINNLISVAYSTLRICAFKVINGKNFQSDWVERISPNVVLEFNKGSHVKLGKKVRIHSGSKVKVRPDAKLAIGDNVKINYNCMIICHKEISIGEGTEFGPFVLIYDHDHDFRAEGGLKANKFKYAPVVIGKNVWIGAGAIILRGTTIGDNSVIAAGTVVKGNIDANTILVQKRTSEYKKV